MNFELKRWNGEQRGKKHFTMLKHKGKEIQTKTKGQTSSHWSVLLRMLARLI